MASKIVDSTGKQVGKVITILEEGKALVEFKINNRLYVQPIYPDAIGDEEEVWLYHSEVDCGGDSFIQYAEEDTTNGLFPSYYKLSSFGWINTHPQGVSPRLITPLSYTNNGCNNIGSPEELSMITLEEALGPDFRAGFTPPFTFKL